MKFTRPVLLPDVDVDVCINPSRKRGYDAAEAIADAYIQFWDDNAALMRVLDLTSLEGDERFRSIRVRLLNEFTIALAGVVEAQRAAGKHPDDLDPMAVAGVLVSMLAHVASHLAPTNPSSHAPVAPSLPDAQG
mgnify:CR=1 FL=1